MKNILLNLFYGPILSIDIGSHTTKILEGKASGGSLNIDKAMTIPTPTETYRDGRILDIDELSNSIGSALKKENIKGKRVVFSIESTSIITREIILPSVKADEIKAMLDFEIKQYLPIDLESYIIQSRLIEETVIEGIRKSKIQVAALPKDIASEYHSLSQKLGLKPMALDLNSNSIHKLVTLNGVINREDFIKDRTIAIIDLGFSFSNLVIIKNGIFKFNRLMKLGGVEIDHSIANSFNLSLKEAEGLKIKAKSINEIANSYEERETLNLIKINVDNWVIEIDRLFKYYTSRENNNTINSIYICGGSSNIEGLDTYLREEFQIPAHKLVEVGEISSGKSFINIGIEKYVNAMGALIRK
ncbi:type IV pilus assembly protein PilM [Alkaliphilus pronyensis]|uniref:type IV pilus assembly protein PilM n=1 Tax=Alkaliphilus pronyensis TaxID=1482732 RepID=UPI0018656FF8|nr:type IV pilus assembly protein PilM [Alkaliphilus pronyensis]